MPQLFLTDDIVLSASCPAGKDQEIYWDHPTGADGRIRSNSVSGLGLRVTALGRKAFIHAYHFNGGRCRKVIGSTTRHNVASARLEVIKRKEEIDGGQNPDANRVDPRRKHFMTIREVLDRYWETHLSTLSEGYKGSFALFMAKWRRQAPKQESRRGHNVRKGHTDFGKMFAERSLYSITPLDIEDYLKQFSSPHSHNYALRHVLAFFNWAIRMQLVDMRNPCTPIRVRKMVRCRRDYSTEQIRQIAAHIFCPCSQRCPRSRT